MCFFTSQSKKAVDIAKRYGRKLDIIEAARQILAEQEAEMMQGGETASVYHTRLNEGMYVVPGWAFAYNVIVSGSEQLQVMQWGLIPHYASVAEREMYIRESRYRNARDDKLFSSPLWRRIINNRCVIPITGFFEPHVNSDNSRTPYYIERKDREMLSIAGLYDEWTHPPTGEKSLTFVMITVPATPKLAKIHNGGLNPYRMPLILSDVDVEGWLTPGLNQKEIEAFLVTPEIDKQLAAWPVRKKFDKGDPFDPTIIDRQPTQEELDFEE